MNRSVSFAWIAFALLQVATRSTAAPDSAAPRLAPCLRLHTAEGAITIELAPEAAPRAVATIERLAREPIFDLDVVPDPDAARTTGYFDGQPFDYTKPQLELRLAGRTPAAAFTVPAELDAAAVGFDTQRVADAGEAMERLQMELLPARQRPSAERRATPRLDEWAARFEQGGYDPSFLIGTSRKELLEAIGYRFTDGLATRPAVRGAVALVPSSPTEATMTLAILLADHPRRTGRWVVVGHVVSGLDLADAIASRPLADAAMRDYRPFLPVVVDSAAVLAGCASSPPEGGTP
jgi:cyclophilin family peptidyl-prolyl cis-trans isomerase